ncbi:nitrogen fixation protein FixH [Palleronia aestuarii]|uniref:Nitrogen fixation protein FixH n=2 Tax=Palleronia aestuarii TaxID=568105 RepID=A0A2W7MRW2_9RHOB|nr:FixH family protein [Palleronia aestuarii]PZX10905.1 nitrogen fixation protein FixH [Palleronia aestuarii]
MNAAAQRAEARLTGRHVAAMFVGGFAIIIAVNVTLAINAVRTFPGKETASSYVASQTFDADRAAQDALGWTLDVTLGPEVLRLAVAGPDGATVRPEIVTATLGRATTVADDVSPDFAWDGTAWVAAIAAEHGNWNLRIEMLAADGTHFRRRLPLRVER